MLDRLKQPQVWAPVAAISAVALLIFIAAISEKRGYDRALADIRADRVHVGSAPESEISKWHTAWYTTFRRDLK